MATKNRQTLLMIVAGAALALFVGDSVIVEPLRANWKDRSDRIRKLQEDVRSGNVLLNERRYLQNRWDQMQTNTLPNDVSQAQNQLLKALETWERESQIKIDRIAPQWKVGDDYTTLECRVDASGTMDAIVHFLYNIEKGPPGLRIDVAELSSRDTSGRQLTLGLQLTGLVLVPTKQQ